MGQPPHAPRGAAAPQTILQQAAASEDVRQKLNLVERALAAIDPQTDYQAAILDALAEINDTLKQEADAGGLSTERLDRVVTLLEQQVMGQVDTTSLPIGLTGEALVAIENGNEGLARFQFAGGEYTALVVAGSDINSFDDVRVVGGSNEVEPIREEEAPRDPSKPVERVVRYNVDVDAGEDILTNDIRPSAPGATLRVSVVLDTQAVFRARVKPDDDVDGVDADADDFDHEFNGAAATQALGTNEGFEFDLQVGDDVQVNYRVDTDGVRVEYIRVNEVLVG